MSSIKFERNKQESFKLIKEADLVGELIIKDVRSSTRVEISVFMATQIANSLYCSIMFDKVDNYIVEQKYQILKLHDCFGSLVQGEGQLACLLKHKIVLRTFKILEQGEKGINDAIKIATEEIAMKYFNGLSREEFYTKLCNFENCSLDKEYGDNLKKNIIIRISESLVNNWVPNLPYETNLLNAVKQCDYIRY